MENPSTWKRAELVILDALAEWDVSSKFGSQNGYIARKLRDAGLLKDQDEPEIGWAGLREHNANRQAALGDVTEQVTGILGPEARVYREAVDDSPPAHDYQMPHDSRYGGNDPRGCPPNCPYGKWRREAGDAGAS